LARGTRSGDRALDGARLESAKRATLDDQKRTELTPGTVLVREWDRRSQRVMVMADGFAWKAKGRRAVAIQADSADAAAVQASVEKTVAELGGLDILVNNAGILRLGELKDISLADIDALLNVNVRAQIIASKAAGPAPNIARPRVR
jgi:NAD(P)-dependent dehydrogenase (short-subunit alcohol dehydrogenase family)